jgi:hypothetical protein
MADKIDIWVYADWKGMASPNIIGSNKNRFNIF